MLKYSVKRIMSLLPVAILISIILFSLVKAMPGDPVALQVPPGTKNYYEVYAAIEKKMGFDQDVPVQYVKWISNFVQGDMGYSTIYKKSVNEVIATPLKNTVALNLVATSLSLILSIIIGIKSAVKKGKFYDKFWQVTSLVAQSLPTFFIGICLIFIFAFKLKLLPSVGMPQSSLKGMEYLVGWLRSMLLPMTALAITSLAGTIRYVRNAMLDVMSQDFIRTARSKGLSEKTVIYSHAFRNALIPVVTIVIGSIAGLFGGAIITEKLFQWNGLGYVLIQAITGRDFWLVISINMFYAIITLIANFATDLAYAVVDPRVRLG